MPTLALADDPDDADDTSAQTSEPPPRLVAVHATLDGATAALTIRYELDLVGPHLSREELRLALPDVAIVTGASVHVDGATHALALDGADAIGSAFDALGSDAASAHPPWAFALFHETANENLVGLDVAAPHAAHAIVDLQVAAPACFYRDARYVRIAKAWLPHVDPALRARTSIPLEDACARDLENKTGIAWLRLASPSLAQRPFGEQRVGTSAGRLALAATDIARVEVDLASTLARVPADLYTVILVDNSRSVSQQQRWEQSAIITSYLTKAPRTHVQVVAYDRRAHALFPGWELAGQAHSKIGARLEALDAANGSNLDVGLAEAARWLAAIHGTRRVIAFTDEQLPWRIEVARLRAGVPDATLVHTVALRGGDGVLERDDLSTLAALASATEGVGFATSMAHGDEPPVVDATVLARPIALEHVRVTAPGWTALEEIDGPVCSDDLAQGGACTWWGTAPSGGGAIRISGQLWGHEVVRVMTPDRASGLAMARTLVATASNVSDALADEIARAARAVDAIWSLAAIWGGTGGYAERETQGGGMGSFGCGCGGSSSFGSYGSGNSGLGVMQTIEQQLAHLIASCKVGAAHVAIDLELTGDEIVDVKVAAPAAIESCVTEHVWDTALWLGNPLHRTVHVEL